MTSLEHLYSILDSFPRVLIAYSGGVDSAFLLHAAHRQLGARALGVLADTPSLPRAEFEDALKLAKWIGVQVEVVQTSEFENPDYLSNPTNRCFFCKTALFEKMEEMAHLLQVPVLAYGENADDAYEHRPGKKAAENFQVCAPLHEAGLTKAEIRFLSTSLGLPTAEKPASPCLSSRIPHGSPVTLQALSQIEAGEGLLRQLGFKIFRLRHHGTLARLEFAPDELLQAQSDGFREKIFSAIRGVGFSDVLIDPEGYKGTIR